jgi:hypothetical protein
LLRLGCCWSYCWDSLCPLLLASIAMLLRAWAADAVATAAATAAVSPDSRAWMADSAACRSGRDSSTGQVSASKLKHMVLGAGRLERHARRRRCAPLFAEAAGCGPV